MIRIQNYIDGKFTDAEGGKTLSFGNPATGEMIGQCPSSRSTDVEAAIAAAERAKDSWAGLDQRARSEFLYAIADEIEKNKEELAHAESLNNGKPLKTSHEVDIPRSALNFKFFAELGNQWAAENFSSSPSLFHYTLRQPLGTVACISPWNLPLYLFTWKIAPALSAGNCVVGKPSEVTPLTAFHLSKIVEKVGLPRGVLNILHGLGPDIGPTLCSHPQIKALSFTGSTATGRKLAEMCAPHFKKLSLEMGGKNATLIFADANIDQAVKGAIRAAFSNQGQICLCGSRILVEQSIFEDVKKKLVSQVQQLKVGDPMSADTDLGAVVSKNHFEKVSGMIVAAEKRGGKILCGQESLELSKELQSGFFIRPTLIEKLSPSDEFNQEEVFGPVATLIPFKNEEEAIKIANGTRYGLSASVWTESLPKAHRVARDLQVGMLWINSWMARDLRVPFGGVKESGLGREGGVDALRFFTEAKSVSVQM